MRTEDSTASFGYWMRRQRQALDMTQADLARRVGCAVVTVSKMERDERHPSRQMAELLAQHLAVPAEQRARFLAAALGERAVYSLPVTSQPVTAPAPEPAALPRHNLPLSFAPAIQRTGEERALLALLADPHIRLLTLVGPGGVGKTHLSLRVAERATDSFRDGVRFVALDAIRSPEMVLTALAGSLGVMESAGQGLRESLLNALAYKRQLLVLDNFEQVLGAAELVGALIQSCPHLKIVVTSREALRLRGEQVYPLQPLALPAQSAPLAALFQNPAAQLFALRARAVQPDFALDGTTAPTVAAICAALDGLPLAIELAAARLALFSLPSLLREVTSDDHSPLRLLRSDLRDTPQRHRSLADAAAWSYALLTEAEQRLFRRLSVFVGSFSLDAAQTVAGDDSDAFEGIHSLLAKSLLALRPQEDGSRRFAFLQTIRDVALELLAQSGEERAIRLAHARWYAALAAEAEPKLRSSEQMAWLKRLSDNLENIDAAINWSIENEETKLAFTFGASLLNFWRRRNFPTNGRRWLTRMLEMPIDLPLGPQVARLHLDLGWILMLLGEYAESIRKWEKAVRIAETKGNLWVAVLGRANLGRMYIMQLNLPAAEQILNKALQIAEELDDDWATGYTLSLRGRCALRQGDAETGIAMKLRSYKYLQKTGDRGIMAWALTDLATALSDQERYAEAQIYAEESLVHSRYLQDPLSIALSLTALVRLTLNLQNYGDTRHYALESVRLRWHLADWHGTTVNVAQLAQLHRQIDQYPKSVTLARSAQLEFEKIGVPSTYVNLEVIFAAARSALSPEEYAAAWAEGEVRSLADVVEELLHADEASEEVDTSP